MNISVVIPARNEEKNLPRCLAALAWQTYKNFECIVVKTRGHVQSSGVLVIAPSS